jgi:hypothetical protein
MQRTPLVALRRTLVTPDVAEAVRQLELRAAALGGFRLVVQGPPLENATWAGVAADAGPTERPPHASMRLTGRELYLRLQSVGTTVERRQAEVEALWGVAVPCGFTPWLRYPLAGRGDEVFHFFGPWQVLYDSLLGEGRGEEAWPSTCVAAQVDVGKWEGDRAVERFVQAQLHRLGVPCGPVDGVVGDRTVASLRGLGLTGGGMTFADAAARLAAMDPPKPRRAERRRGFVSVDGPVSAVASGKVALTRSPQGYALAIDGPGRVILDVGDET